MLVAVDPAAAAHAPLEAAARAGVGLWRAAAAVQAAARGQAAAGHARAGVAVRAAAHGQARAARPEVAGLAEAGHAQAEAAGLAEVPVLRAPEGQRAAAERGELPAEAPEPEPEPAPELEQAPEPERVSGPAPAPAPELPLPQHSGPAEPAWPSACPPAWLPSTRLAPETQPAPHTPRRRTPYSQTNAGQPRWAACRTKRAWAHPRSFLALGSLAE